jgi:thiaminase/transcriptional activator TenA
MWTLGCGSEGMVGDVIFAAKLDHGLFGTLRRDAGEAWHAYIEHPFVLALGAGTLPEAAFRNYLAQDYLFLIQFARAYALAAYKSGNLAELRAAGAAMTAIVDVEMPLHIAYCRGWGLSEADMEASPEAMQTVAYTRFVLDRGTSGDRLDLDVALAPCVIGYAEVANLLKAHPATKLDGNPYAAWIEMYAGPEYQAVAIAAIDGLERTGAARGANARYPDLLRTFVAATVLETEFWQMSL